jgi:hypothetical protein
VTNFSITIDRESRSRLGRIKAYVIKNAREAFLFRQAARNASRQMKRQFQKTTATWDHPVTFTDHVSSRVGGSTVSYEIRTTDRIWHWLDEGTDTRYKRSDPEDPYQTKTVPTAFTSYPGGGSMIWNVLREEGGSKVLFPVVGIRARNWSSDPRTYKIARQIFLAQVSDKARQFVMEMENA